MDEDISSYLKKIIADKRVFVEVSEALIRGAVNSGEAEDSEEGIKDWFNKRFKPNSVVLDKDDYSKALIRSLWIAPNLASLDFGGGRLRDFAQLWTDTARGFLGEIAVQKFLKNNFNFDMFIETRRGKVEEFMPTDIFVLEKGKPRKSNVKVSVKTGKFNARWIEIPESQFKQSDVFVLVKLGISRYHFSSYLKMLKTVEQLFERGIELKELDEDQIKILSSEIPDWMPIPAYISGFVDKSSLKLPIHSLNFRTPRKRQKTQSGERLISKVEIESGIGLFSYSTLERLKEIKEACAGSDVPFIIAGINKEVDGNFYASSGQMEFEKEDWDRLVRKL